MFRCLLALLVVSSAVAEVKEYNLAPLGFSTSGTHYVGTGEGVAALFPFNLTEDMLKGLVKPEINIFWKKEFQGKISLYFKKGSKPGIDGNNPSTAIDSTNTCTGYDCWSRARYTVPLPANGTAAGLYWLGFSGSDCLLCSTQKFYYVTIAMSDFGAWVPYEVTPTTRGSTRTFRLGQYEVQQPVAKIVLTEPTNVYVELDSFQDWLPAQVNLVYFKDFIIPQTPGTDETTWNQPVTKETNTTKSWPHPGGSEIKGEWNTGAYLLPAGTWYVAAIGGAGTTKSDFQLCYGVGSNNACGFSGNTATTATTSVALVLFLASLPLFSQLF